MAIQIYSFICLFTFYLPLTKKANNNLLNKYVCKMQSKMTTNNSAKLANSCQLST